jgi:8-oxo-dGTP pyrophosphatase MutT (NUDIX family)
MSSDDPSPEVASSSSEAASSSSEAASSSPEVASSSPEVSAGGVVVRDGEMVVVVPIKRGPEGQRVLALPKGHPDPGETLEQAATREVREEAGVEGELLRPLGEVRYTYTRGGRRVPKVVSFYLFSYRAGDPSQHDHEIEEARWMPIQEARSALTYPGEREMIERAMQSSLPPSGGA